MGSQMFVLRQSDTNTHPSENGGEGDLNADYIERTNKFLNNYKDTDMGKREKKLRDPDAAAGEMEDYPTFALSELGECNADNNYGYVIANKSSSWTLGLKSNKTEPCIFIKLNTIWGWVPKPYDCDKEKGEDSEGRCLPDIEKHLTRRPWLVAFDTSLKTKASLSPTSLTWARGQG